jgi:bifunctional non-homologous end joining protein LigD
VPLHSDVTYDVTKPFAKAVAELLEREEPGLVVPRQTKSLRRGKVLVDWSQNDEHKTTVNVYSLRARDRPTVSTPLTWDEVREGALSGDPERLVFDADAVRRAGGGAGRPLRARRVACAAASRGLTSLVPWGAIARCAS